MSDPTLNHTLCPDATAGHRIAWWQWGAPNAQRVVICVHGLSRQGRDFDTLAQALVQRHGPGLRVICPDVAGRGQSDWLQDPQGYQIPNYAGDMVALLTNLANQGVQEVDWVGTSMGGLIGLALAGQPVLPTRLRRLVLNDVGPVLPWQALKRIGDYLGAPLRFESVEQAADALWMISTSFGPHTREQWLALNRPMVKPASDGLGGFVLHYDPAIAIPFRSVTPESAAQGEALLWQCYDAITAPTLLLRGANSDLLTPDTARAMTERGPRARLVEFAGVGHAPTLIATDQVDAVCSFLLSP